MTRKTLSPEDMDLWLSTVRDVRPLSVEKRVTAPLAPLASPPSARVRHSDRESPVWLDPPPSAPNPTPADRRVRSKMWKGRLTLDARLDLHGLTVEAAEARFFRFLHAALQRGDRWVLVITGKGADGQGALRQALPQWLKDPTARAAVVSYTPAPPQHGGEGAVCLLLRRHRSS